MAKAARSSDGVKIELRALGRSAFRIEVFRDTDEAAKWLAVQAKESA